MALDAKQVRVALNGRIYYDPNTIDEVGDDPTGLAIPATAIDLGYATDDGVTFTLGKEIEEITGWQSMDPLRLLVSAQPKSAAFALRQLSRQTWLSTMGGTVTISVPASEGPPAVPAVYHWEPTKGEIPTGSLYLTAQDGPVDYLFGFRRAQNRAEVEFQLVRTDAINLPNEWSAAATADGREPFFLRTNDPAWAPAGP